MFVLLAFLILAPLPTMVLLQMVGGFLAVSYYVEKYTRYKGTFKFLHMFEPYGFKKEDIPDLSGKTFIVTGSNSGLGFGTARHLAQNGADVIMAVRNVEKGEQAKTSIGQVKGELTVMELDNASLASVKRFSNNFKALNRPLHGLILNAGIMAPPFQLTEDGIESQFQVNYVAAAALALDLLPTFDRTQPTTITMTSSIALFHSVPDGVYLDLVKINDERNYNGMSWYGQSKLAVAMFTTELSEKLGPSSTIRVNCIHPGGVRGNLNRYFVGKNSTLIALNNAVQEVMYWSEDEAALTLVGAAVAPKIVSPNGLSGKFFVPVFRLQDAGPMVNDARFRSQLWEFTTRLLGERGCLSSLPENKAKSLEAHEDMVAPSS